MEPSTNDRCYPPKAFDLIPNAFRPSDSYEQIPGLLEEIEQLSAAGRFRSALKRLFQILQKDPGHEQALLLAMTIVGSNKTQHLQAKEPLTPGLLQDTRLDPIYTVCSQCRTAEWISTNCILPSAEMIVTNPAGLQCYNCGYVVCRDCLSTTSVDNPLIRHVSNLCPNCRKKKLSVPVYPTGRVARQMARRDRRVLQAFVFREGPIPPDATYMEDLLESCSPDVLEDKAELVAMPMFPWPDSTEVMLFILIHRAELLKGPLSNTEHAEARDRFGNRAFIVKIYDGPLRPAAILAQENGNGLEREAGSLRQRIGGIFTAFWEMLGL